MSDECLYIYIYIYLLTHSHTHSFIQHVRAKGNPLIQPIITPRFVITCTAELMAGLGSLAAQYDTHIQVLASIGPKESLCGYRSWRDTKSGTEMLACMVLIFTPFSSSLLVSSVGEQDRNRVGSAASSRAAYVHTRL